MKIVYIYPAFVNVGGIDKIIINKANFLADKLRYEVYLITNPQNEQEPFFPISGNVKYIDLRLNFFLQHQYSSLIKQKYDVKFFKNIICFPAFC